MTVEVFDPWTDANNDFKGYRPAASRWHKSRYRFLTVTDACGRVRYTTNQGEKMTRTFDYTDQSRVYNSSAVGYLWYNENTRQLAVTLADHDRTDFYVYDGVPREVFEDFLNADSKGSFYARVIKRNYGPAVSRDAAFDVSVYPAARSLQPKNLTYAPDAKVDNTKAKVFDLKAEDSTGSRYTVNFVVGDDDTLKSYNTEAGSLDDALRAFNDVAEALDLPLNVKSVTVYFD